MKLEEKRKTTEDERVKDDGVATRTGQYLRSSEDWEDTVRMGGARTLILND